jgi:hypothetical protein
MTQVSEDSARGARISLAPPHAAAYTSFRFSLLVLSIRSVIEVPDP